MFIEKDLQILAEFHEKTRALYQTEAFTADFQQPTEAKNLINDYVSNQTQGMIKELISELDIDTLMVLVNYIYFKGKWKISFDPQDTFESEKIGELYLPKFSISTDYNLKDILPELGIKEIFSKQADLSGITGTKDLSVSQVVHKAVLDVAETGTEAAAATGFIFGFRSRRLQTMTVQFNRPFLMVISHTGVQTTLFMAKVTNPK
ncbi:mCG3344, isoform CRA_a [Mus musculus]|nr:mCG3344, isoform CRA_a [Mus musculus]